MQILSNVELSAKNDASEPTGQTNGNASANLIIPAGLFQ